METMTQEKDLDTFEQVSPMLMGLAYRILGSWTDAEDAVQDTYLKWHKADRARIENPSSWLTTLCTRRCIDLLRSAHRTRVSYVGTWLPEPVHTRAVYRADEALSFAPTLETAFLLLLERLTPKERAAYLLHDIFEAPYPEVAAILGLQESTCRKLVSRARTHVDRSRVRHVTPPEKQEQLLAAFEAAIAGAGTERLAAMLSDDVELWSDGGGKVPAVPYVLRGKSRILMFVDRGLRRFWSGAQWTLTDLNGGRGAILLHADGPTAAVTFACDEHEALKSIFIVRSPDKLTHLSPA